MAATTKPGATGPASVLKYRVLDVTFDASYPSGGYAIGAASFLFSQLHALVVTGSAAGYAIEYNLATGKLVVYQSGSHTHVENTAAAYVQNATTGGSTAAALAEPVGANLSAVTVRLLAWGE